MEEYKLYGCKNDRDANVKIIEYVGSYGNKYIAYFGSYDNGIKSYVNWINCTNTNIIVVLFIKVDNKWVSVEQKCINKDNIDISTDKPFTEWFEA